MRFPYPPRDGLEPDWLTKAAGQKLPHRGRASPAAFGRQAAPPNRLNCWSGIADFDRKRETRAGKRKPTISRRRTKVAANKLPKRCEALPRNLWPTED